jgi:hypothetical protein
MSDVYRNGFLNIAASIAADGEAGCFPMRSSTALEPCIVRTTWDDHENSAYQIYHQNSWNRIFKQMPLNKRAWVVQETLLAPKMLFLCGNQMFWKCHELTACEQYSDGVPPGYQVFNGLMARCWYRGKAACGLLVLQTMCLFPWRRATEITTARCGHCGETSQGFTLHVS